MRLGRQRLTRGLLLRLGLLLAAAGLTVHIYLETKRRAAPAAAVLPGGPATASGSIQDGEQRSKLSSGEEEKAEKRRRTSYVRSPTSGLPAGGGASGTSAHLGVKVTFRLLSSHPDTS